MRRRDLLLLMSGAGFGWPAAIRAQQPARPVIGFLGSGSAAGFASILVPFREGLKQAGYTEGENVAIEYVWAEGNYERLPGLAENLVRRKVAVIVAAGGAVAALAAKAATSTIPIVISIGDDPLKFGVVSNLGRPGGNVTGVTLYMSELAPKRLELLAELTPRSSLAILLNPHNPNAQDEAAAMQAAAQRSGRELRVVNASSESEIEAAVANIAGQPDTAMIVGTDPFFFIQRAQIAALAARHAIPAIYFHRVFAMAGGLVSYGATITAENRIAGMYTGRILKGERPGDLPVQQPSTVELVVNLKAARAQGITIPTAILIRTDEVIE
jgi:putative tryptophan/tyrosine transport system substrate-binding protein